MGKLLSYRYLNKKKIFIKIYIYIYKYRFGTQLDKNDLKLLLNHTIKVLMVLFWFMILPIDKHLKILKISFQVYFLIKFFNIFERLKIMLMKQWLEYL